MKPASHLSIISIATACSPAVVLPLVNGQTNNGHKGTLLEIWHFVRLLRRLHQYETQLGSRNFEGYLNIILPTHWPTEQIEIELSFKSRSRSYGVHSMQSTYYVPLLCSIVSSRSGDFSVKKSINKLVHLGHGVLGVIISDRPGWLFMGDRGIIEISVRDALTKS